MDLCHLHIRVAAEEDASALLAIYAPYVEKTAVTFEYSVPSEQEFRDRIKHTLPRYPWIVAEVDGIPLGYAYASAFHPRAAYGWCSELSIYLHEDARGCGLGKILYARLENILKTQGVMLLYACIARADKEDPTLTHASIRFHEREGYHIVGDFPLCGFKFGRWYSMVWMEKRLREPIVPPPPLIPFAEIAHRAFSF